MKWPYPIPSTVFRKCLNLFQQFYRTGTDMEAISNGTADTFSMADFSLSLFQVPLEERQMEKYIRPKCQHAKKGAKMTVSTQGSFLHHSWQERELINNQAYCRVIRHRKIYANCFYLHWQQKPDVRLLVDFCSAWNRYLTCNHNRSLVLCVTTYFIVNYEKKWKCANEYSDPYLYFYSWSLVSHNVYNEKNAELLFLIETFPFFFFTIYGSCSAYWSKKKLKNLNWPLNWHS